MDEIMKEQPYGVYVREDTAGRIYDINSDAFIFNTQGWVKIDEGYGDRYHHAQGNYLPKPKMDERGILRYRSYPSADAPSGEVIAKYFKDGVEYLILERTQEEMDGDYTEPEIKPSIEARVETVEGETAELREALDLILSGVTE